MNNKHGGIPNVHQHEFGLHARHAKGLRFN